VGLVQEIVERFGWLDLLDVLLLTLVAYRIFLWLRGTVALQVLGGLAGLVLAAIAAERTGLLLTGYVLQAFGAVATLLVIVLFQEEIRRALRDANPLHWLRRRRVRQLEKDRVGYRGLSRGLAALAQHRTGALVVMPRVDAVDEHLTGGTRVGAQLSPELLEAIFNRQSPLHDGAVVLRHADIDLAGAVLPLTTSIDLPEQLGTRHRAAIGLSERCDAVVVVVSEERGEISVASAGRLRSLPVSAEELAVSIEVEVGRQMMRPPSVSSEGQRRRRYRDGAAFLLILMGVFGAWLAVASDRSTVLMRDELVELRNVAAGYEVDVVQPRDARVQVRLRGPRRLIGSDIFEEVTAYIDLSAVEVGKANLPVKIVAPHTAEVVEVRPDYVVVMVRRAP
jgi:uncharacterized protein (TIGR00159 family)